MKAVNSLLFRECHLRFSQWCCRIFGPSGMLHCVRNIPGNSHPQQKSPCKHFSWEISHYGVNEQTETTLPHTPCVTLIFERKASQNFITKLVMQSHVYCALRENKLKMINDPLPTTFVPMQYSLSFHPTHYAFWWYASNQEAINMFKKTETKKNSTAGSMISAYINKKYRYASRNNGDAFWETRLGRFRCCANVIECTYTNLE